MNQTQPRVLNQPYLQVNAIGNNLTLKVGLVPMETTLSSSIPTPPNLAVTELHDTAAAPLAQ